MPYAVLGFLTLALWVYCLVDIITSPDDGIRHLPKMGWILVVVLVPTVGALLWLFAGRPVGPERRPATTRYSEYDRPGRAVASNPDDDEAFLRGLRERAEQQRREARRQQAERDEDQA
ncbi:PLD nuclease N-terminal domain-containing protein [Nocardia neocaledoniensis]|uniref:Phospholipase D-like protein n=1 Tax=Nocardia neocaledoniensis TaxID=236511 RepID=A0A317NA51_9NOCA|nr:MULTISPECIES: PLD nuclease N-terminal domain-containing protein [Nocardia]PWV71587.1 phospholipase D-like protein [Nocardia neocaledoniensis]UGT55734.1 PLD nuclease N-terminal domain-containing protein [Nocardia asteroides]GEM29226.1 membrane protein [Nocardia neocaledoniensis NBRC 108232]